MRTATRVGGYALALCAVFAAALGAGTVIGPIDASAGEKTGHGMDGHADDGSGGSGGHAERAEGGHAKHGEAAADHQVGGLSLASEGYAVRPAATALPAGPDRRYQFQIVGPDERPVTAFRRTHDKRLHLVAVRRDMGGFQHVHPTMSADGTWSTSLDLSAGDWRVFADFAPTKSSESLTLGTDLSVAGDYRPRELPKPSKMARVGDYSVALSGDLVAGEPSKLALTVRRDGRPVTDLQPYLAAYGHLVALRDGDLGYLHVHPEGEPGDGKTKPGPTITFTATAPTAGSYRLFLDFRHDGVVRTAEFTATARPASPGAADPPASEKPAPTGDGAHGHSGDGQEGGHR